MGLLLSPVCIDSMITFQNGGGGGLRSKRMLLTNNNSNSIRWCGVEGESRRRRFSIVKVATDPSPFSIDPVADDYYAVLGLVSQYQFVFFFP